MKFKNKIEDSINNSIAVKQKLLNEKAEDIHSAGMKIADLVSKGGKVLFCGNGGSAADSQHLAAELVIRLRSSVNRAAIPGIALTVDPSIMTAGGNDIGYDNVFARGVEAYGRVGDVLIGISTSGNSENVLRAINQAKKQNVLAIGLLGKDGGKIAPECDLSVIIPSDNTARIQESHILVGHIWCEMIEEVMFPELF